MKGEAVLTDSKYKILVLGVGGNVSQGIVKALKKSRYDIRIIGACIAPSSVGLYLCEESYICPMASDSKFTDWYIDFCNTHEIDMVFTGVEENIDVLLKNRDRIEKQCKAVFVYPDEYVWDVGNDKSKTCAWLKDNGFNYPRYIDMDKMTGEDDKDYYESLKKDVESIGYPLICKPKTGKSAHGTFVIHNSEELLANSDVLKNENFVIEKCIGSDASEYTVGCYCDKKGKYISCIITKRILKNGSTVICSVEENNRIREYVRGICEALKNPGPINVQLRLDENGEPVCFELNVRFSGTTAIRNELGFCDVDAAISEYLLNTKTDNSFFSYRNGCAIRFEEEKYFSCSYEELQKKLNGVGGL